MFKSSVKTLHDLFICPVFMCPKVRPRSNLADVGAECAHDEIYMYTHTRQSSLNPKSKTLEPDRPQHDRPAACVIAQQYSSVTLVLLRCHSRKEQFDSH